MTELLTPPAVIAQRDPAWSFDIYIPGRPRGKGSPQPVTRRRGGQSVTYVTDREVVMQWVATVSAYALQERLRRAARGDKSFPYLDAVELWPLFVYERPKAIPEGPPTTCVGINAVADLDKLLRAVGDALSQGSFSLNRQTIPKAGVLDDDRLITRMGPPVKCYRDETEQDLLPGAYLHLTAAPTTKIDGALYGWKPSSRWRSV